MPGSNAVAPGEQRLAFATYDIATSSRTAHGPLPLTPGTTLSWIGFSEEGLLAAADSAGVLRSAPPSASVFAGA